jgi:heat shock protein HtpX
VAKRLLLFFVTNLLVVITVSIVLWVILPALGIQLGGGVSALVVLCAAFGMGGAVVSLLLSRWTAKRAYGIELVDASHSSPQARAIHAMVEGLARDAGLPSTPEVGVYQSPEPNAFATGPSRDKGLVAFSTGLLQSMNESEVRAVAAHELSHIANGDMVTMTLLQGVANALVMFVARLAALAIDNFLRDDDGGGLGFFGYIMVVVVLESALMVLAYIPIAYFSRKREFRADRGAAGLTEPGAMISALKRLEAAAAVRAPRENRTMALAKIHSKRRVSLWSTHPSTEERIMALETFTGA